MSDMTPDQFDAHLQILYDLNDQASIGPLSKAYRAMTEERDAVLHGGVTEEMLRRQDGTIRLAKGCCIVIEHEWDETLRALTEAQQEIKRLQSLVGDMVRVMCPGTLLDTKEGG